MLIKISMQMKFNNNDNKYNNNNSNYNRIISKIYELTL